MKRFTTNPEYYNASSPFKKKGVSRFQQQLSIARKVLKFFCAFMCMIYTSVYTLRSVLKFSLVSESIIQSEIHLHEFPPIGGNEV